MDIAQKLESAEKNVKETTTGATVLKLSTPNSPKQRCFRCGQTNHNAHDCKFRDQKIGSRLSRPITTDLKINGTMEVDTGAAVSLISHKHLWPKLSLSKTDVHWRTYTCVLVNVQHGKREQKYMKMACACWVEINPAGLQDHCICHTLSLLTEAGDTTGQIFKCVRRRVGYHHWVSGKITLTVRCCAKILQAMTNTIRDSRLH